MPLSRRGKLSMKYFKNTLVNLWARFDQWFISYPSDQYSLRYFLVRSRTPSNHCQNVNPLPGRTSCKCQGKCNDECAESTPLTTTPVVLYNPFSDLVELCPWHFEVLQILRSGDAVPKDLLGQEEIMLLAKAVGGLHFSHELLVESLTHGLPGDTLSNHEGNATLEQAREIKLHITHSKPQKAEELCNTALF